MISCKNGRVKISGEIDRTKAEATVLMNAIYGAISKEDGEESADKFLDELTKRAKMSKLELISDVLGDIGECAGGFEKGKKYIFDKDTYINDMFEPGKKYVFDAELCRKDGCDFKDNGWINEIDGMEVRVITPILGRAKFYAIAPTWCREVE